MIDTIEVPFNKHVGLLRSDRDGCLLRLDAQSYHENHLGTIHAGALFILAEAASGEFLIVASGGREGIGGVIRKTAAKYSRPATGVVDAQVRTGVEKVAQVIEKVEAKGKALIEIEVSLLNEVGEEVAKFQFTWFLARSL